MAKVLLISFRGKKGVVKVNNQSCAGSPLAYFALARAFFQISIVTLISNPTPPPPSNLSVPKKIMTFVTI